MRLQYLIAVMVVDSLLNMSMWLEELILHTQQGRKDCLFKESNLKGCIHKNNRKVLGFRVAHPH